MSLRLEPCSQKAALYAVKNWHYSRSLPVGKLVCLGCWHDSAFWGVVVFGRGASKNIGKQFGMSQLQVVELVRIALKEGHPFAVTKAIKAALAILRVRCPGIRLVVSMADAGQGHLGRIYQAANWVYVGKAGAKMMRVLGKQVHSRTVGAQYNTHSVEWLREHVDPGAAYVPTAPKFKYVWPIDKSLRSWLLTRAKPYPKRLPNSGALPTETGGASPTQTLQTVTADAE